MKKNHSITAALGAAMLSAAMIIVSCNEKKDADTNVDVMTQTDSVDQTVSDGLGREVDTVQQIDMRTQDSLMDAPAP